MGNSETKQIEKISIKKKPQKAISKYSVDSIPLANKKGAQNISQSEIDRPIEEMI